MYRYMPQHPAYRRSSSALMDELARRRQAVPKPAPLQASRRRRIPVQSGTPPAPQSKPVAPPTEEPKQPEQPNTLAESQADQANPAPKASSIDWQEKAQSLQAEMDAFRQRQVRRANEAIQAERERLLEKVLPVLDNLSRALNYEAQSDSSLLEGVSLVRRQFIQVLESEGLQAISTENTAFNPEYHEAVATVPNSQNTGMIVEEVEAGYLLNNKLLRPAKVVVAV